VAAGSSTPQIGAGGTSSSSSSSTSTSTSPSIFGTFSDALLGNNKAGTAISDNNGLVSSISAPFQSLGQGLLGGGALGLRTCYPQDGAEVVAMASGSNPCTVLILSKSSRDSYVIRQTMNITTPKVKDGDRRIGSWSIDHHARMYVQGLTSNPSPHDTHAQIFIGNPIDPPILNTTRIERLFDGVCEARKTRGGH
jgi:hypothetical protein